MEWYDFYYMIMDKIHTGQYNAANNVTGVIQYFESIMGLTRHYLDPQWKHQDLYYNLTNENTYNQVLVNLDLREPLSMPKLDFAILVKIFNHSIFSQ